jgi:hypothetical protein
MAASRPARAPTPVVDEIRAALTTSPDPLTAREILAQCPSASGRGIVQKYLYDLMGDREILRLGSREGRGCRYKYTLRYKSIAP